MTQQGTYIRDDEAKKLCVSLDLETIPRGTSFKDHNPLAYSSLPVINRKAHDLLGDVEEEIPPTKETLKLRKIYDWQIVALSAVVMLGAEKPNQMQLYLGSLPPIETPEPISEADLLYAFAYAVGGIEGDEGALTNSGVNLDNVESLLTNTQLPDLGRITKGHWPIIFAAHAPGDLQKIASTYQRLGMSNPLTTIPPTDRSSRARHHLDDGPRSAKSIDVLRFPTFGNIIKDQVSLQELCINLGLPTKYYQKDNVPELWRQGKLEELIEYNRVDALLVHFITLWYMAFDGVISSHDFKELWESSAKQLEQQAADSSAREEGISYILRELPSAEKMKLAPLRPRFSD